MAKVTKPTAEQLAEKQRKEELDALRSLLPQKPFGQMSQVEINKYVEVMAKEKGLI
jgi:Na+-translocating ferredoxin:NAD+ oxidoreductase RnfG subunit